MDLIYMDERKRDIGVMKNFNLDLAYGEDENNFELTTVTGNNVCKSGFYIYAEGTDYGGIIDSIEVKTSSNSLSYKGRTWHGILGSKILEPDSGQDYYLAYFDHWLKEDMQIKYVVRYMDDIVIFSSSKAFLHDLRRQMDEYLRCRLDLHIKPNWQVFPVDARGVDFVGYRFFHGYKLLRKTTCKKFKKKMVEIQRKQCDGNLINYSEWCSANSYNGWLKWCNSYRLRQKYIEPIQPSLDRYYNEVIKSKSKRKVQS